MLKIAGRTKPYKVINFTAESNEENIIVNIALNEMNIKITILDGDTDAEKEKIIHMLKATLKLASYDNFTVILSSEKDDHKLKFEIKELKKYRKFCGELEYPPQA